MKIRIVEERTGPRHDGRSWPPRGGEIDVDDAEGAAVCAAGWAVPVAEHRAAETPEDSLSVSEEQRDGEAAEPAAPASSAPRTARSRAAKQG